jgi:hypothetical protein
MTKYYPVMVHDRDDDKPPPIDILGAATDYDGAHGVHVARVMRAAPAAIRVDAGGQVAPAPRDPYWRPTVLLDLGTLDLTDEDEARRLLTADPILRAVYELGRQHELLNSVNRRDARLANPGDLDG